VTHGGQPPEPGALAAVRPVYLAVEPDPVLALLHLPAPESRTGIGVVFCPPFGWDDVCSYRSRRAWAEALADVGHSAVRLDLPGTGDSAGTPRDPRRLEAWSRAVFDAASWLRSETGCERVTAIGIGLGGLVACQALGLGAQIDDLVLWAVPANGRALLRELRAFARLEADRFPSSSTAPTASSSDRWLEAGGFVLTEETVASLEALDLTALPLSPASGRRVLMLKRDGLEPDRRLRKQFERSGAAVTVQNGDGYGAMMDDPRLARPPRGVFATTIAWMAEAAAPAASALRSGSAAGGPPPNGGMATSPKRVAAYDTLDLICDGAAVREMPLSVEFGLERLFGVLTSPADGLTAGVCAVLLNAGALRRIGPNRLWVEVARSWAARGVPTLRIDLRAIGDSDGDERAYTNNDGYYAPELTQQALATLDRLVAHGMPNRFILAGVCSGAYWSFRGALADERIVGAFMINLWSFFWSPSFVADRNQQRARTLVRELDLRQARTIFRDRSQRHARTLAGEREHATGVMPTIREATAHILQLRRARRARNREIEDALDRLRDRDTRLLLQFSDSEPLYEDLVRSGEILSLGRWPNLHLARIPSADHTFRALWLQRHVRETLDHALEDVLQRRSEK